ncbi:MAG: hypothetical protein RLZZ385_1203 [Pseudomonadota bacterium]|jgi:cbb3-type cytochrome oxidase subunit 3
MMTAFIFIGDMLVMAFMIGVVIWAGTTESRARLDYTARIPLEDEQHG